MINDKCRHLILRDDDVCRQGVGEQDFSSESAGLLRFPIGLSWLPLASYDAAAQTPYLSWDDDFVSYTDANAVMVRLQ